MRALASAVLARARGEASLGRQRRVEVREGLFGELLEVVRGGARFDREHVHTDGSFTHCPEPVTLGKVRLCQEGADHFDGSVPVPFHGPVLRLTMRRRRPNLNPMRTQ